MLGLPGLCGEFYDLLQVVASYLCGKEEVWLLLGKGFTSLFAYVYYRDGTWIWGFASLCVGAVCTLTLKLPFCLFVCLIL